MLQKRRYVNDNVHGLIRCTSLEVLIMQQAVFSRLHGVYQNSVAYLTWPSNRNQRFEHSIGTMKLAGDMLFSSIMNAEDSVRSNFLRDAKAEIQHMMDGIDSGVINSWFDGAQAAVDTMRSTWESSGTIISNDDIALFLGTKVSEWLPDFSWRLVPGEVGKELVSTCYMLTQAVRMAGMLHDVGHPPFSHAVEHALENLRKEAEASAPADNPGASQFKSTMDNLDGEGKTHERMGMLLTKQLFDFILRDLARRGKSFAPLILEYYLVYRMTDAILKEGDRESGGYFTEIHQIINATIDADRLDFVRRDSLSSGIGLDAVQYPRITGEMKLCTTEEETDAPGRYVFAFPTKSIDSLEAFVKQRFQNYDTIVWHHRVVKTEVLLDNIVLDLGRRALSKNVSAKQQRYRHLPQDITGLWVPFQGIAKNGTVANKQVFGQWNDAWLITTLTGEYVDLCLRNEQPNELKREDNLLLGRLAELLYGERHYISLIKRFGDLLPATKAFHEALRTNAMDIEAKREVLYGYAKPSDDKNGKADEENLIDASASAEAFLALLPQKDQKRDGGGQNNPLVLIRTKFEALSVYPEKPEDYCSLVGKVINKYMRDHTSGHGLLEHLVRFREPNVGMDGPTYVYGKGSKIVDLDEVSNVKDSLVLDELSRPPFYVYVRFADEDHWTAQTEAELRKEFVEYVAVELAQWYIARLEEFLQIVEC